VNGCSRRALNARAAWFVVDAAVAIDGGHPVGADRLWGRRKRLRAP